MVNNASSPALVIISAMITPVLLILGSGSLVTTAVLATHKLSAEEIESFPLQFPGFLMTNMPME